MRPTPIAQPEVIGGIVSYLVKPEAYFVTGMAKGFKLVLRC